MTNSGRDSRHGVSDPSRPTFLPGDLVGERYRIARLVGAGSTGEVHEAVDQALGGAVALKTLKHGFSNQPVLLERFRREIQNARRVTHPNVCRIFDMGVHRVGNQQRFFLTMEMLVGESLAAHLAARPALTAAEALPLLSQIAAGLQAAHDSGVMHRDLKPGNVMLLANTAPPRAVITDFGLAISVDQVGMGLTESSELIGTPEYMAPEQTEPASVTPATDVYALGIIAYEMLAKQAPFEPGTTPVATVLKRRHEAPRPLRRAAPSVTPLWDAAILRCLDREPKRRFQRPVDFILALQLGSSTGPDEGGWVGRATRKLRRR
jgi:serine/threonine protein kinase